MKTVKFTCWQDGDYFRGFLNHYPDYRTQGTSKDELLDHLRSLLAEIESGEVPFIRADTEAHHDPYRIGEPT